MAKGHWKTIGKTDKATIQVDYKTNRTRIITKGRIYYHKGAYPFHEPRATRVYRT